MLLDLVLDPILPNMGAFCKSNPFLHTVCGFLNSHFPTIHYILPNSILPSKATGTPSRGQRNQIWARGWRSWRSRRSRTRSWGIEAQSPAAGGAWAAWGRREWKIQGGRQGWALQKLAGEHQHQHLLYNNDQTKPLYDHSCSQHRWPLITKWPHLATRSFSMTGAAGSNNEELHFAKFLRISALFLLEWVQ